MSVESVSDVTESFDVIETGLINKINMFVKGKIVVKGDAKKFDMIRQRDS